MGRNLGGSVLADVRQLCGSGTLAGLGDAELLARFAAARDEAAFAVLVGRHGPMVRAACWAVSGDAHAAEDAFQATFLALARRAGAIRVGPGGDLAGWLYRVARRAAVRGDAIAARRRRAEAEAAARPASAGSPSADAQAEAAERARLLLDEVDRLPGRLRLAVILCHLEGRTQAEAAARLGATEAAVRGRLERARRRLRARLAARGLAPAAASAMLTPRPAEAVLPAWAETAVRAAAWLADGRAAEAAAFASAYSLMKEALSVTLIVKLRVAALAITTLGLGSWMAAMPAAGTQRVTELLVEDEPETWTFSGRVIDLNGRPIAGAAVLQQQGFMDGAQRRYRKVERVRTDAAGRFRFVDSPQIRGVDPSFPHRGSPLEVVAEGYGPGGLMATFRGTAEERAHALDVEFILPRDDVPILGRIIDRSGRPVDGAKITPQSLKYLKDSRGAPIPYDDARGTDDLKVNESGVEHLIAPVTTGPDGRFRLSGFGRDRVAVLEVSGPGIRTERVEVVTREGRADGPRMAATHMMEESITGRKRVVRYDAAEFIHVSPLDTDPARLLFPPEQAPTRTVYLNMSQAPAGQGHEQLQAIELLIKAIETSTPYRVVGSPEEADLILRGTFRAEPGEKNPPG